LRSQSISFLQSSSPNQLERKLNLPGGGRSSRDLSGARNRRSVLIQNELVIRRRDEIGVIEDIEKLGAKLNVEGVGNSLDWIVLKE
jgi:hypothetical protein